MSTPINPEEFLSFNSSSRAIKRARTATGNYVATVLKPSTVTHSCVGCFTGPNHLNLIICKGSLVEIYLMIENELQPILDFPVVEKLVFMELSRLPPATEDFLFIATELYKFCVLRWDARSSKLITINTMRYQSPRLETPTRHLNYCQGGTICPRSSTIVLYSSQDWLRVITNVNFEVFETFTRRVLGSTILDAKFLYGHGPPTVALLFKQNGGGFRVRVYEISGEEINSKGWQRPDVIVQPTLLIPVHQDPYGFLIIGKIFFVHVNSQGFKTKRMGFFNIKAYGRFRTDTKKDSYLLGDHDGSLLMLELPELTYKLLGRTSIPSSISYLCDTIVFVGSCSTDSQLIKIHLLADLQVLKTYANSGPISDFCLINKPGGQRKILMCRGTYEKSVLEVFCTGTGINPKFSLKAPNIINVWSLKSSTLAANHTYLIIQTSDNFISAYILVENGLRDHTMNGFISGPITLCCHVSSYSQFVQVTEESVRLISPKTGLLKLNWIPGYKITCASTTPNQILLATDTDLVYLQIGDTKLFERNRLQMDYDVACLDISPLGDNLYSSQLAAVGTWGDNKVRIYSLPDLTVLTEEQLSCLPRCILLCAFGVEWYLLCSLGDGTLCTFQLNKENSQLQDKNFVPLGPSSKTLRKFSSNGEVFVFLSTNAVPTVIFYKNKKMQYKALNLPNVADTCPFHCEHISEGVVVITKDGLVLCTLGEIAESGKIPIVSYGRRICHQEETRSCRSLQVF